MSKDKDNLGDRMKAYEKRYEQKLIPYLPIMVRLDGKCFSKLTKGFDRPFDSDFHRLMVETTKRLVDVSGARIGFTQSDEISLVLNGDDFKSEPFMGGKLQKLSSILASTATLVFNSVLPAVLELKNIPPRTGLFDCRVWNVPNELEACNALKWREMDATKNSVSMATRSVYSHKEMHEKGRSEMMDMLHAKGINWNNYPAWAKRGTYVQRKKQFVKFTPSEIECLPQKHEARTNPDLVLERTIIREIEMPPCSRISNYMQVVFCGEDPEVTE